MTNPYDDAAAELDPWCRVARAIIGQIFTDLADYSAEVRFNAKSWLFEDIGPPDDEWRESLCELAGIGLRQLRKAAGNSDDEQLRRIGEALKREVDNESRTRPIGQAKDRN